MLHLSTPARKIKIKKTQLLQKPIYKIFITYGYKELWLRPATTNHQVQTILQ